MDETADTEPIRLIWERPEPDPRRRPTGLSRAVIVRTAMAIADADGLDAVSLRRVAAGLGTGAMRLYGYVEAKDDLLDLMADAVYAQMPLPGPARGDWRADLRAVARGMQQAARCHPWFVALVAARQPYGPHAMRHMERTLASFTGHGLDAATLTAATDTFFAYVHGYIQLELLRAPLGHRGDPDDAARARHVLGYLARTVADGEHPTIARVFAELGPVDPDAAFFERLECVLDGVAALITR